jgi:hypothetical protein
MANEDVRLRLLGYLDEHVFEPVLKSRLDGRPQNQHSNLDELQQAALIERERFQSCRSAEDVCQMFEDELRSETVRTQQRQLRELELPTLDDVQLDFRQMADELGIREVSAF